VAAPDLEVGQHAGRTLGEQSSASAWRVATNVAMPRSDVDAAAGAAVADPLGSTVQAAASAATAVRTVRQVVVVM